MKRIIKINGMGCQKCVTHVKEALEELEGVELLEVKVGEALVDIPEGYEIDHLDEDKANNNLSNLALKTRKENMDKMLASNPHLIYNLKQFKTVK